MCAFVLVGRLSRRCADYDGQPNLSCELFGGWSRAYAKQYKGTTSLCSAGVDLNYRA